MADNERLAWIDAARGIGMCFVVAGHSTIPAAVAKFIWSFHMPLFFFLSGYLYRGDLSARWGLRKVESLLIPYCLYGLLEILVRSFCDGEEALSLFVGFMRGTGVGVTWFLTCLFVTEIIGALLVRRTQFSRRNWWGVLVILGVATLSWLALRIPGPCYMMYKTAIPALVFWLCGLFLRLHNRFFVQVNERLSHFATPVVLFVFATMLSQLQRIDMAAAKCGSLPLFFGTALMMTGVCLYVAKLPKVCESTVLCYIGRHSLLFLGWHALLPTITKFFVLTIAGVELTFLVKVLLKVFNIGVLFVLVALSDRYVPALAGRSRLLSKWTVKK